MSRKILLQGDLVSLKSGSSLHYVLKWDRVDRVMKRYYTKGIIVGPNVDLKIYEVLRPEDLTFYVLWLDPYTDEKRLGRFNGDQLKLLKRGERHADK